MTVYLINQRVGIFQVSEPTAQDILVTLFNVGRLLNWNGVNYRVEKREQSKDGNFFFYLSDR
jgi:hypothetical protein